jgi:polysaccharide export outer membrane protein
MKRLLSLLFILLAASPALLAQFSGPSLTTEDGSSTNAPIQPTTDPAILYPVDHAVLITFGDQLQVRLFNMPEFSTPQRVALDGSIQVPLLGPVPVIGLTIRQASDLIAQRLRTAGMYNDPQVTVQLLDSPNQAATVSGEMHGVIPLVGRRSLFSVLSAAGQYPPTASHTVIINRPGVDKPIVVDLGTDPSRSARADVPIFSGDTIVVPRTGVVYLLGAFKTQGAIPMQQNSPLTLMQAASLGGGVLFEASYKDLRIVRTVGYERKVVKLNVKDVMHGKAADPILQADDIVFLPSNGLKAALNNGGFAAFTSLASLLLIALQNLNNY